MSTTTTTRTRNEERAKTTVPKVDKKKIVCGSCESELEPDDPGIQCIQGHHFCVECSKQIVGLFFSEPHNYIPLRCVQCHIELNANVFERQLTPNQLEFYSQHMLVLVWAKELVGEDECLVNCSFCNYAVIRSKHDQTLFFCQRPDCGITSCLVCRKSCPKYLTDFADDIDQIEMLKHFTCADLAEDKQTFDEAIEGGQKVPCPNCGLAGMKDDSCTHMTCPTCSQIWCYFCGKGIDDCDKARNSTNGIIDHNHNWHINPKRCPMYLTQIQDVDQRWPADEVGCLNVFHRVRSLGLLRDVFNRLGPERIKKLNEHFHSLDSCGFSENEILHENLTLIQSRDRKARTRRIED